MTRSPGLMRGLTIGLTAGVLLTLGLASAEATTIIRTGTDVGLGLRAWVRFEQAAPGAAVVVTLANISTQDFTTASGNVTELILVAVFFNLNGTPSFTKVSALLADQVNSSGTQVTTDSTAFCSAGKACVNTPVLNSTGGDVGSEWAYKFNSAGLQTGKVIPDNNVPQQHGISSADLGLFGKADRFDTVGNLNDVAGLDGVQYGLTTFGDVNTTWPTTPAATSVPLIHNAVTFSFLPTAGYTLSSVTDVRFQYGNDLVDNNIDVTLPPALLLLSSGLLGVAGVLQARRRRKTARSS